MEEEIEIKTKRKKSKKGATAEEPIESSPNKPKKKKHTEKGETTESEEARSPKKKKKGKKTSADEALSEGEEASPKKVKKKKGKKSEEETLIESEGEEASPKKVKKKKGKKSEEETSVGSESEEASSKKAKKKKRKKSEEETSTESEGSSPAKRKKRKKRRRKGKRRKKGKKGGEEDEDLEFTDPEEREREVKARKKLDKRLAKIEEIEQKYAPVPKSFLRRCCEKLVNKICPILAFVAGTKPHEYRAVKQFFGFIVGILFGIGFYYMVLNRLNLEPFLNRILGLVVCLICGVSYAYFLQMRAIMWLTLPTLAGNAGRAYMQSLVIAMLVAGPYANIVLNCQESMRVMGCLMSLNFNHTLERYKLMFMPLKEIVEELVKGSKETKKGGNKLRDTFEPIKEEVTNDEEASVWKADTDHLDDDASSDRRSDQVEKRHKELGAKLFKRNEAKYGRKMDYLCEEAFTNGAKGCRENFQEIYQKCMSKLGFLGSLVCWMTRLDFMCNIMESTKGRRMCTSQRATNPGFGESYETADGTVDEFNSNMEAKFQYKMVMEQETLDLVTPRDVTDAINEKYFKRKRLMDFLMNLLSRLLTLVFLFVLLQAKKYNTRYLTDIKHDNIYVTDYFKRIDWRRMSQGKAYLLPLKRSEKLDLIMTTSLTWSGQEKKRFILGTMRIIGQVVMTSLVLAFDYVLYDILMILQRTTLMEFRTEGVHHIKMTVHGVGFISDIVRALIKGFDKKHELNMITTNSDCLPVPGKLEVSQIVEIYVLYLLVWLMLGIESYSLRLRRLICGIFYRKREKRRVIFLYNDRLKKRRGYLRYLRHRVRKLARNKSVSFELSLLEILRYKYPKYFGWLSKWGLGKRRCLVCQEKENKNFQVCPPPCYVVYCQGCWLDLREKCYVCTPEDDYDSPLTDDEF